MTSRRNRTSMQLWCGALAAALCTALPALALAKDAKEHPPAETAQTADGAAAARGAHAHGKADKNTKKAKPKEHPAKPHSADAAHKPQTKPASKSAPAKKTASRETSKKKTKKAAAGKAQADAKAPQGACYTPPVTFRLLADKDDKPKAQSLTVVDCEGRVVEGTRQKLSFVRGASPARDADLLDPGVLYRIDAIARNFPGRTMTVVNSIEPGARGSLHQTGRALDIRLEGVSNAELSAFCRKLLDTGCGYYPNSGFVHIDARVSGAGTASWIDASRPGEAPKYVTDWPVKADAPNTNDAEIEVYEPQHRATDARKATAKHRRAESSPVASRTKKRTPEARRANPKR